MTAEKTEASDLWASHLAVEHALLFETQVLGGVGHYGEGGFGVMPEGKEEDKKKSVLDTEMNFSPGTLTNKQLSEALC